MSNPINPVSYQRDIYALFRDQDVNCMTAYFNLRNYQDVSDNADDILSHLDGSAHPRMPPDGSWPPEQIALFRKWITDGKKP